jgi:hypothetical protein
MSGTYFLRTAARLRGGRTSTRQIGQAAPVAINPRHVSQPRHLAPTDQPFTRDCIVGGAIRVRRDDRRAVAGEASDAVHAGGIEGIGEGHLWQDGGEPARPHRLPRPGGSGRYGHNACVAFSLGAPPGPSPGRPSRVSVAVRVEPPVPVRARWRRPRRPPAAPARCLMTARGSTPPQAGSPGLWLRAAGQGRRRHAHPLRRGHP